MLSEPLVKALSSQLNGEFYSAYLYLGMSAYADRAGYKGIANWLYVQAQEERAHAVHIYQHILERGASPVLPEVKAPPSTWRDITELFEKVLSHEQGVTASINNIASLAAGEKDHATYNFIMWYVNEQVEEEKNVDEILAKIKLMGSNPVLIFHLDSELATRTFVDPFAGAGATA
ncbi:ferritin [Leadbettera azotonutricia]|uniref:Ferritin n=1 Tax=Leadbettera azotonutricia (strain ATCC BAA-888 / DSM 13862 / ZAS-9) TaxID=545695 RepID=F5YEQ0_LEAAZ|nr:ferritin [Leadbettera azotonutricia]AEF81895.1 ferritin [Leadbettera azotonutricia ZAS-9]